MHGLRLLSQFIRTSLLEDTAHRANFIINLIYSLLNLLTGVLGIAVIFGQVETVRGWNFNSTLALLGIYLIVSALRGVFISPSLDALAGMDGEIWSGRFDFTVLRPVSTQFLASFRRWRLFALFDLALGLGVLGVAMYRLSTALTLARLGAFVLALAAGVAILYAILLVFAALVFWSPGVLFTWVFDGIFQMARYPLGMYPGWLRLVLTWVVPVGLMTTLPAEALTGVSSPWTLWGAVALAVGLVTAASWLFQVALRRYASASS